MRALNSDGARLATARTGEAESTRSDQERGIGGIQRPSISGPAPRRLFRAPCVEENPFGATPELGTPPPGEEAPEAAVKNTAGE